MIHIQNCESVSRVPVLIGYYFAWLDQAVQELFLHFWDKSPEDESL